MKVISVEDQYNKFSDLSKSEVLKLVEWTHHQKHLPNIDELEAILFLYSCHNSMELAKKTVDLNFTMRTLCPEFFSNRNVLDMEVRQAMDVCGFVPLPFTTTEGDKIILTKFLVCDPNEFHFTNAIKLYFMCFDLWMMEEGTAPGYILAMDMSGCVLGHILRINPFAMKKFLFYLQEACPVRIKGFHFINTVPVMDKLLAIMKPFMKKELLNVMHLHPTVETFYPFVSREYMPKDYGGKKETHKTYCDQFYSKLRENQDYFQNEERTRRIDEKLREGKPKNVSEVFGVEGNFKKLDID